MWEFCFDVCDHEELTIFTILVKTISKIKYTFRKSNSLINIVVNNTYFMITILPSGFCSVLNNLYQSLVLNWVTYDNITN